MATEAYFEIDCSRFSDSVFKIVELLYNSGWSWINRRGNVEFLPLGSEEYDWSELVLNSDDLQKIFFEKQLHGEKLGIVMYNNSSDVGITILAQNTKEIIIDLNVNPKRINDKFYDLGWYYENILIPIREKGCIVDCLKYEEYEG